MSIIAVLQDLVVWQANFAEQALWEFGVVR
jgi:hypothetical protein